MCVWSAGERIACAFSLRASGFHVRLVRERFPCAIVAAAAVTVALMLCCCVPSRMRGVRLTPAGGLRGLSGAVDVRLQC